MCPRDEIERCGGNSHLFNTHRYQLGCTDNTPIEQPVHERRVIAMFPFRLERPPFQTLDRTMTHASREPRALVT